jgi:transmembrane sensor
MSLSTTPTDKAREEAADWFARLKRIDVPASDLEAFRLWRKAPGHKEAYDEVDALWRSSPPLLSDPDIEIAVQSALGRLDGKTTPRRSYRLVTGLAFGGVLLIAAGFGANALWGSKSYSTAIGEQRLVQLSDGSSVKLDTQTKLVVRYSSGRRDLELQTGQALFDVAHDPARPFVVKAGETQVTALGTRFDVRRDVDGADVTLVRGSVEVRRSGSTQPQVWRLKPGQALATSTPAAKPRPIDVAAATSWSEGRLVFHAVPLSAAIAEINRYSREKVVLDVESLAPQTISGVFDTGDTETFVSTVADYHDLVVSRSGEREIRLARAQNADAHQ